MQVRHPDVGQAAHYAAPAGIGTYRAALINNGGVEVVLRQPLSIPPGQRLVSGIVKDGSEDVCYQQVGEYDEAYVRYSPASKFKLDEDCASRGFPNLDPSLTRKMFDEPTRAGNGAYRR